MKIKITPLNLIDFDDQRYSILPNPAETVPEKLRDSIGRIGILHPPLIIEQSRDHFVIISGRQRLLAAVSLHQKSCECRVLNETATPVEIFSLLLEESLFTSSFTIVEQALFLKKVLTWISKEEAAQRFLPVMGIPPHTSQLERLLRLTELEEIILTSLQEGNLDSKVAYELQKLSFNNRLALFEIITTLRLSVSNQKKLLLISRELAARQGIQISDLLGEEEIQAILNQQGNIPLISKQLFTYLHGRRFPRATEAEEEFTTFVRDLSLPATNTVQHSPFFEKDEVSLTITFADRQTLAAFCQKEHIS